MLKTGKRLSERGEEEKAQAPHSGQSGLVLGRGSEWRNGGLVPPVLVLAAGRDDGWRKTERVR